MNFEKLKSILFSSLLKMNLIMLIMLGFSIGILTRPLYLTNNSVLSVSITFLIGLPLFGMSVWFLIKQLPLMIQAKRETHPLLKAIKEGQKDYLVWVFIKQINTTVGHDGPVVGGSKNVSIFPKDSGGKGYDLVLNNSDDAANLVRYLTEEFEVPYLGFSDQTREAVYAEYSGRGWKKI